MYSGRAILWQGVLSVTAASIPMLLAGCLFDRLQQSQENDIRRVEQKQASLQAEQVRSAKLSQQEEQLAAELGNRELSVAELNERVEQINAENGRTIADNDAARLRYRELLAQLHESNEQITAVRFAAGSVEERRERLDSLKSRLRQQVDILLRSN